MIGFPEVTENKGASNLDLLPLDHTHAPCAHATLPEKARLLKTMAKISEISKTGCTHTPPTAHLHCGKDALKMQANSRIQAQQPRNERHPEEKGPVGITGSLSVK